MKKLLLIVLIAIIIGLSMTGCNYVPDTTLSYERAIVYLPNGEVVEGELTSWTDFEDGDQIQVKIDGKVYLTHIENVVLISE